MKILLAFLLLVTLCQADMYERDEDAFRFLSNMDIDQITQTVENEVNQLVQKNLTPDEIQWVHVLADDFAESLRQEMEEAVLIVMQSGHLNHQFTTRMLENLRRAAQGISNGLNMTHEMLDRFLEDMTKGIDSLEESGLLEVDLDPIFQNLAERALSVFEEKTRKKRDIEGLFGSVNNTLQRIIGNMNGRFQDLHDFFEAHMEKSRDKMKPQIENLEILARNFIANIKSAQRSVLQHAIEFFAPFAHELGEQYIELITKVRNRLQRITETPIPAIYK